MTIIGTKGTNDQTLKIIENMAMIFIMPALTGAYGTGNQTLKIIENMAPVLIKDYWTSDERM